MLAFANNYYGLSFRAKQSVELFCAYDLYAYMIERTIDNLKKNGKIGYIIPLSGFYTPRMKPFNKYITDECKIYLSSFGVRPSKIFKNAEQRVNILFGTRGNAEAEIYTSEYIRWYTEERSSLFSDISYVKQQISDQFGVIPKIGSEVEVSILKKIFFDSERIEDYENAKGNTIVYYHGAARYWLKATDYIPYFYNEKKETSRSSEWKEIHFSSEVQANSIICLINSSLFFWYWILMSDERHFSKRDIMKFPYSLNKNLEYANEFDILAEKLMSGYKENSTEKTINTLQGMTKYQEFYPRMSKDIIDEIDRLLGKIYGLSELEVDFIINNAIRFRMGE